MSALDVRFFGEYFRTVHGYAPFAWQAELAQRVIAGPGWPEGIDVPTGLGKTAVIDIAVFALAVDAGLPPAERRAPTRTFMVVDRRVIVDQSYDRAQCIAAALHSAPPESLLGTMAARLRSLSQTGRSPLEVVRMRGGTTWGSLWLTEPSQPAVILSTVDQFGSRLLFRGYGVSDSLRPINAALCGADSLVILDEAHLSQPLIETMGSVRRHEARSEVAVPPRRPLPPVLLSATLPDGLDRFVQDLDNETSEEARRRLDVERITRLVDVITPKDPGPALAEAMAALALDGAQRDGVDRVGVVCNTVRLARQVFALLGGGNHGVDVALLIGRCRPTEREAVTKTWLPRLRSEKDRPPAGKIVAVATQTIEVGADLDVDFLVTEAAPLDALLQRLGRLNRLGRTTEAEAVVVHANNRHGDDDPVYGRATGRTWEWLVERTAQPEPVRPKAAVGATERAPWIDLGPRAVRQLATSTERRGLSAEATLAPVVLGPIIGAWALTRPAPLPDQPVAPYLHGIGRPAAEVQVCWRGGLPPAAGPDIEAWEVELRTAPVRDSETVSVPIWEAARFLSGPLEPGPMSDLEGAPDDLDIDLDERQPVPAFVVGPDGTVGPYVRDRLRPGHTVVLQSEAGGHDQWGWTGVAGAPVPDVADLVLRQRGRVRLRAGVLVADPAGAERKAVDEILARLPRGEDEDTAAAREAVAQVVSRLADLLDDDRLRQIRSPRFEASRVGHWWVASAPLATAASPLELDDEVEDDDAAASSTSGFRVHLDTHLRDVAELARQHAELLGLPPDLVAAVELAGRCHDLGKADDRFQAMLRGGSALEVLASGELLAKSGMDSADKTAFRRAQRDARWPVGMRHESISAALFAQLVRTSPELVEGLDPDLVHHLIQTHHGYSRPLLPAVIDADPRKVSVVVPDTDRRVEVASDRDIVDWESPDRCYRLARRYGWWGLALLESVVRMADMAVSRSYDQRGDQS